MIILSHLDHAWRESFLFGGQPVEAFVHDEATLRWFLDADVARGRPGLLRMVAEGIPLGSDPARADRLHRDASRRLSAGPPRLDGTQLDALRYAITDALDDMHGRRTPAELLAIGATLHPILAELALRGRSRWNAAGKWIPRALAEIDPDLATRFDHAFRALFADGDPAPAIALAEAELFPHGGPLFDGDHRPAPTICRRD